MVDEKLAASDVQEHMDQIDRTNAVMTDIRDQRRLSRRHGQTNEPRDNRSRRCKVAAAIVGYLLTVTAAFVATSWVIVLSTSSIAQAQSMTVSNLTITAAASPAVGNVLYPGGSADVVVTISNPNPYPVTLSATKLPTNATYASGFTTSALSTAKVGCSGLTPSDVIWSYSTATSGSSHTLTAAITVAATGQANNPLTVTFTSDASMTAAAPAACEDTYFSMPSLTEVAATIGSATVTTSPATDSWTS